MTESSPVVPSVGAVPVEMPEDVVIEAAAKAQWELHCGLRGDADDDRTMPPLVEWQDITEEQRQGWRIYAADALRAAYPLIAARVRAEGRQRIIGDLARVAIHPFKGPDDTDMSMLLEAAKRIEGGYAAGGSHTRETTVRVLRFVAGMLAAGSAVPDVPPGVSTCPACWTDGPNDELCPAHRAEYDASLRAAAVPVATPPTFDALLSDPAEQFDTRGELLPALVRYLGLPATADVEPLMRSIEEYRNAPPAAFTVPAPVATPGLCQEKHFPHGPACPVTTPTEPPQCRRCGFTGDCTDDVCHGPVATTPPPAEQDGQR